MNRVGEFEKVSFEQYYEAIKDEFYKEQEMTPALKENIKKSWEALQLPSRATSGSAGYDFKAPFSFSRPISAACWLHAFRSPILRI